VNTIDSPNVYKLMIAGDESNVSEQLTKIIGLKKNKASNIEKDN
jgi:hypothetical protein